MSDTKTAPAADGLRVAEALGVPEWREHVASINRDFTFNSDTLTHTPIVTVKFKPVPSDAGVNAGSWPMRDKLAYWLAAPSPTPRARVALSDEQIDEAYEVALAEEIAMSDGTTPDLPEPVAHIDPRGIARGDASLHCITRPEYRSWADADADVRYLPVYTADQVRAAIAAESARSAVATEHIAAGLRAAEEERDELRAKVERQREELDALQAAAILAINCLENISDVYVDADDDCGECASCHERSYRPHAPGCAKQAALVALRAAAIVAN